ncbi:MAG TPA: alkaline phosphatase family protein, partial [Opitutus sp.]|nr:alkaline phosphatase family protein [Opitutus sp.]
MSGSCRRFSAIVATIAVLAILVGCASSTGRRSASNATSPLVLISLDGFAAEYFALYPDAMPNLQRLRREGVAAQGLISVFPSNTFPSHYTLVTGLYPGQHGIINNEFFDPTNGKFFRYTQQSTVRDSSWWKGEPIWVTAIRQGKLAATSFWVGSEAAIGGVRPTYWKVFDAALPFETRLEEFVGWLKKPVEQRPALITFYLEETNGSGHRFGPHSPELVAAIKLVDSRVGELLQQCESLGLTPNVVIVSDHGMTAVDPQRVSILEDFIDLSSVQIETEGSVVGLRPLDGHIDSLLDKVNRIPHAKAYRAEDLPAALHWTENPRWSPVWILADEGA